MNLQTEVFVHTFLITEEVAVFPDKLVDTQLALKNLRAVYRTPETTTTLVTVHQ
jgi:hypothetical protein